MNIAALLFALLLAADPIAEASSKVVKLYGAGAGRVEAYGTGVLVGGDGKIVTALVGMLQGETVVAVLADGRRRPAKLAGADSTLGLALLTIENTKTPFFDLKSVRTPETGEVVYALSNQFNIAAGDEPVSVQRGVVSGRAKLTGRMGVRNAPTTEELVLVDASMCNPGAAGGALVDANGNLVGLIGRELRNVSTDTWVHYAVPASWAAKILRGESGHTTATEPTKPPKGLERQASDLRGIVPLPDWLDQTPPFVDSIEPGSPAEAAGLKSDDLVMFVERRFVKSAADLRALFAEAPADKPIRVTVERRNAIIAVEMKARKK